MSIRLKLFTICFCLIAVTLGVCGTSLVTLSQLSSVATSIYDEAFLSVSYLRSAQNGLLTLEVTLHRPNLAAVGPVLKTTLDSIATDLQVAQDRAMSPEAHQAIVQLGGMLHTFEAGLQPLDRTAALAALELLSVEFDNTVETFTADAFLARSRITMLARQSAQRTWAAACAAVVIAGLIAVAGFRAIVPAIRRAVAVADAVAAGRLDTEVQVRGNDEAAKLLRSLAIMQASIAKSIAEMAASREAVEQQHAWLDAALNNMVQGLCLLDAQGGLIVANARFHEMFDAPLNGTALPEAFSAEQRTQVLAWDGSGAPLTCSLPDGRSIGVARKPVVGGGWVVTFEDVTQRHAAQEQLAHMARHDALTGLPNRVLFREHVQHGLAAWNHREPLTLLCLDLDRFKAVNDTLGHPAGDRLLQAVTARLLAVVRRTDMVVRLGGDEFAIVREGPAQPGDTKALAGRIIEALSQPFEIEGQRVIVGASIGISFADGQADADALLKRADMALYQAKASGRGRMHLFEAGMDERIRDRRLMESDLRRAIERDELDVFYHPFASVESGAILGFEALLRWRHRTRGMVPPAVFIPMAEEIGLIEAMGEWVLRRACIDAAGWPVPVKVAVNLSALQFASTLPRTVADALDAAGLPATRLDLEVTESIMITDGDAAVDILHELKASGIRISMDDFGTGYSSLSYFERFPFDKVKIDQSFVRQLHKTPGAAAIVRAIIGLGASLGMTITAEGVETEEQLEELRREGCDEVQGYLLSKPKPAHEVADFLRARLAAAPIRIAHGPSIAAPRQLAHEVAAHI